MSELTIIQGSEWEPEPRVEQAPRTEPEARTEPEPKTEIAARTEPDNSCIQSIKCPLCGYIWHISKGTEKQSVRCTKCGNVFEVE
jgi:rubredoxin